MHNILLAARKAEYKKVPSMDMPGKTVSIVSVAYDGKPGVLEERVAVANVRELRPLADAFIARCKALNQPLYVSFICSGPKPRGFDAFSKELHEARHIEV